MAGRPLRRRRSVKMHVPWREIGAGQRTIQPPDGDNIGGVNIRGNSCSIKGTHVLLFNGYTKRIEELRAYTPESMTGDFPRRPGT